MRLQEQLQAAEARVRHLRETLHEAQRVVRRNAGRGVVRLPHSKLVLLRAAVDLGGLNPVAMTVARRLLGRIRGLERGNSRARLLASLGDSLGKPALVAEVTALRHDHPGHRWLFKAARLVAELRVGRRVLACNLRGATADAAQCVQWLAEEWPPAARDHGYAPFLARLQPQGFHRWNWLRRFRLFWGLSLGRFKARAEVAPELQSQRVL